MSENPLRKWRKANCLRAVDIALRLAVSEQSVLAFETGRFSPSSESLSAIAELMNVGPSELALKWRLWRKNRQVSG